MSNYITITYLLQCQIPDVCYTPARVCTDFPSNYQHFAYMNLHARLYHQQKDPA